MPTPPAWFVRKLRQINRHFSVAWDATRKAWTIYEEIRWTRQEGYLHGAPVYRLRRSPQPALRFPELGSRVLDIVRRNDPRRFLGVKEMVKGLNIDGH